MFEFFNLFGTSKNSTLNHLDLVLSKQKKLREKNLGKYYRALGGNYKIDSDKSLNDSYRLFKLGVKNNIDVNKLVQKFKGSAPKLYSKLERKIKKKYLKGGIIPDDESVLSDGSRQSRGTKDTSLTSRSDESIDNLDVDRFYLNKILDEDPNLYDILITTFGNGTIVPVVKNAWDPLFMRFKGFMKGDLSKPYTTKLIYSADGPRSHERGTLETNMNYQDFIDKYKWYTKSIYTDSEINDPEKWKIDDILFWLAYDTFPFPSWWDNKTLKIITPDLQLSPMDRYWALFGPHQSARPLNPYASAFRSSLANYLIYYLFVKKDASGTYLGSINGFVNEKDTGNQIINWRIPVICRLLESLYTRLYALGSSLMLHDNPPNKAGPNFQDDCNVATQVLQKCQGIIGKFLKSLVIGPKAIKSKFPKDIEAIYTGNKTVIIRYFLGNNDKDKYTFPRIPRCESFLPDNYSKEDENRSEPYVGGYKYHNIYDGGREDYRDYDYDGGRENYRDYDDGHEDYRNYDYNGGHEDYRDYDYNGGRDRYYPDSMHGGALGLFRGEINRNLYSRELILKIE
jgi:hypothetical protein